MSKSYYRYCQGVKDSGKLVDSSKDQFETVTDTNKDWYRSLFQYNQSHKDTFETTGSIRGITDVVGTQIYFDFDSEDNMNQARQDTIACYNKLLSLSIPAETIQVYFSGNKGFGISLDLESFITPEQHADIVKSVAGNLTTFDPVVTNASRIIRIEYTKHAKSGLYKLPISIKTLTTKSIEQIKELARSIDNAEMTVEAVLTNDKLAVLKSQAKKPVEVVVKSSHGISTDLDIDFARKPKFLSNCKYALLQGHIPKGQRQIGLTALAATYKALGFDKQTTYDACKGALRRSQEVYGEGSTKKEDIWNNILPSVYSASWEGGTYSCRTHPWMKSYCDSLDSFKCKHNENEQLTVTLTDIAPQFQKYAEEFEKNIILPGVPALDKKCRFLVGTSSGILGSPGSGKSSLMYQILNSNSLKGNNCLFFSLDMYYSHVYTSLARRHSLEVGNKILKEDDVYDAFKNNTPLKHKLLESFQKNYGNVEFCFKSGISVEELGNAIRDTEDKIGKKMRLVVIDYSQLIFTNISDPTAASALVANTLRKVANDCNVAMLTLFQPNKANSDPRKEITQYTAAKGSGSIAESMNLFLTLNRPGWSNQHPETDKFATINAVKNRNGALFRVDMGWEGSTGNFRDLLPEEHQELAVIREELEAELANPANPY